MPVINGMGWNPESTPFKQFALNRAIGHLLGASISVAEKRGVSCVICDMTCGSGIDATGQDGSPLILAEHIQGMIHKGHKITLVCVDWNTKLLADLRARMNERYPDVPVAYFFDQATAMEVVPKHAVGLTYWDTNRYNELDTDLLSRVGRSHYYMDILITRECLAGYRMMRAAHCQGTLAIHDYLALTGKKRNYVMQYAKHGWWSFGFADNWEDRSADKMKKLGLVDVRTPQGQQLYLQYTQGIKPQRGPMLKEATLW